MLLDEATAALDKDSESEVIRTLVALSQGSGSSSSSSGSGKKNKNTSKGAKAKSNGAANRSDAHSVVDGDDNGANLTNRPPKIVVVVTHR